MARVGFASQTWQRVPLGKRDSPFLRIPRTTTVGRPKLPDGGLPHVSVVSPEIGSSSRPQNYSQQITGPRVGRTRPEQVQVTSCAMLPPLASERPSSGDQGRSECTRCMRTLGNGHRAHAAASGACNPRSHIPSSCPQPHSDNRTPSPTGRSTKGQSISLTLVRSTPRLGSSAELGWVEGARTWDPPRGARGGAVNSDEAPGPETHPFPESRQHFNRPRLTSKYGTSGKTSQGSRRC